MLIIGAVKNEDAVNCEDTVAVESADIDAGGEKPKGRQCHCLPV